MSSSFGSQKCRATTCTTSCSRGSDPNSRMLFQEPDMAGFAQSAKLEAAPGTRWDYTDGNYVLLSRVVRDAVGGTAQDVIRFAQQELFDPLGMSSVALELDVT